MVQHFKRQIIMFPISIWQIDIYIFTSLHLIVERVTKMLTPEMSCLQVFYWLNRLGRPSLLYAKHCHIVCTNRVSFVVHDNPVQELYRRCLLESYNKRLLCCRIFHVLYITTGTNDMDKIVLCPLSYTKQKYCINWYM